MRWERILRGQELAASDEKVLAEIHHGDPAALDRILDDTLVRTAALPADEDDRVEHGERWDMQE